MASDVQLPWGHCTDEKNSDKGKCPGEVVVGGRLPWKGKRTSSHVTCSKALTLTIDDVVLWPCERFRLCLKRCMRGNDEI